MKKILRIVIFFTLLAAFPYFMLAQKGEGIVFAKGDWSSMLAKAKAEDKLIFVDVYTTWCGPCKMVDHNIFPKAAIGAKFNANFINYKVDAEYGEGPSIADRYDVRSYPNFLFINGEGKLVHRMTGYQPVESFLKEANIALSLSKQRSIQWYAAHLAERKNDSIFVEEYLENLKFLGLDNTQVLSDYLSSFSNDQPLPSTAVRILSKYLQSWKGLPFELALKTYHAATGQDIRIVMSLRPVLETNAHNMAINAISIKDRKQFDEAIALMRQFPIPNNKRVLFDELELDFARMTNDLPALIKYSEKVTSTLMAQTPQQIRKQDSLVFQQWLRKKEQLGQEVSEKEKAKFQGIVSSNHAIKLSKIAWTYFLLVNEKAELTKALDWSARALELSRESSELIDVHAHLYYKLGQIEKALAFEQMALELDPENKEIKQTLAKMKKGDL
jgi:thiol-disulfide isomerase/thioredoxin